MIRAIIIDLDGTTLPRGWNSLSEENKKALEEAGRAGITRVLATGRSVFSFRNALPEGLPIDYMVFSSGAGIMHRVQVIMHRTQVIRLPCNRIQWQQP